MAVRYLKIDVTREQSSWVYVAIDDDVTPLVKTKLPWASNKEVIEMTNELSRAAELAARELDELEWGDWEDGDFSAHCPVEVTEEEAKEYDVFDATGSG